jgi:hypothetical protein
VEADAFDERDMRDKDIADIHLLETLKRARKEGP